MTAENFIAIAIDEENGSETWWSALDKRYPAFADSLRQNRVAVIRWELWNDLSALPGFDDGPEHARNPILDYGSDGEQWAHICGQRHGVFETLS